MKSFKALFVLFFAALMVAASFAPADAAKKMSDEEFIKLCESGTPQQVQEALKAGADANAKNETGWTDFNEGVTALMIAAYRNENPEVVSILANAGADIDARDIEGGTALMWAANRENPEFVSVLLKAGADVNARDKVEGDVDSVQSGLTVLMYVARNNGNPEVISALVKAGADVNAKDDTGTTALMCAAFNNENPEIISALLASGADVNAKDNDGWTALMYAVYSEENAENKPAIVSALIKAGADVNAGSDDGETALKLAIENEAGPEVISILKEAGAK
jgi:ankyrin repeat protein